MLKAIVGLALMAAAVAAGLYFGIWYCFIGGIVDVINACKQTDVPAMGVAIGLLKFFMSGIVGWGSFILLFVPGAALFSDA